MTLTLEQSLAICSFCLGVLLAGSEILGWSNCCFANSVTQLLFSKCIERKNPQPTLPV